MGSVNILSGLSKHLGTAKGYVVCNQRIKRIQEMMADKATTYDECWALTGDLAKLYSWQARNLRQQIKNLAD